MNYDEIWADMTSAYEVSNMSLAQMAGGWPGRNRNGWPSLEFEGWIWSDEDPTWRLAAIDVSLSPGLMTPAPNLQFSVDPKTAGARVWGSTLFLLPRPDLSEHDPAYEARWTDPNTYQQRYAVISSSAQHMEILADYLRRYWGPLASEPTAKVVTSTEPVVFPPDAAPRQT